MKWGRRSSSLRRLVLAFSVMNVFWQHMEPYIEGDERNNFFGSINDQSKLNTLRPHFNFYFHVVSVGGINPLQLGAMARPV